MRPTEEVLRSRQESDPDWEIVDEPIVPNVESAAQVWPDFSLQGSVESIQLILQNPPSKLRVYIVVPDLTINMTTNTNRQIFVKFTMNFMLLGTFLYVLTFCDQQYVGNVVTLLIHSLTRTILGHFSSIHVNPTKISRVMN